MRWTDLPAEREPADAASGLRRGQWDDLRERLERLPPGHPSRPGWEESADGHGADPGDADQGEAAGGPAGRRHVSPSAERRGVQDDDEDFHGGDRGGRRDRDAAGADLPDRGAPYRPWFSAGEPPEPWFSADPR